MKLMVFIGSAIFRDQHYYPQWQHYAPYAPQSQCAPWYAPQCVPHYDYNQDFSVVNTNTMDLPHQSMNVPRENREASQASVSSSSSSTSRSRTDPLVDESNKV